MSTGNLADQLQIWGVEKDTVIFKDGSLGFGLELVPRDVSCLDDDVLNQVAEQLGQWLNGLPDNIDIQFVQDICSGNRERIESHAKLGANADNAVAKTLAEARSLRLLELDQSGQLPRHALKLFVRKPLSSPLLGKPKLLSRTKLFPEISEERLDRECQALHRLQDDLMQGLNGLGLQPRILSSAETLEMTYWQWNPTRKIGFGEYDPEDVRSSLLYTDVSVSELGFSLSNMHHRVISLKMLPDRTISGVAQILRQLPFDSRLFVSVHVPNQQREIESLQTQRRIAYSIAFGKTTGVRDVEGQAKFRDLEELLEQLIAQGEKVFQFALNIVLRSKSEEELDSQIAQTLTTLRELGGAEGMEESLVSFDIFSELSIPNARCRERTKRIKTSNLCDLLPVFGPWNGHTSPSILLRSRMGSLVNFDPFSSDLTNANQIISGGSGSGKSYLTNILLLQILKENPRVFIVDIGGSYKKLCENLGGQYIPLGAAADFALNPFDLAPGETEPSSQKIKFLLGLVDLMTKEDGDPRLPKLERAEIEEAIQRVYREPGPRTLSRLKDLLLANPETQIRRYGRILGPWSGATPYGKFFDRDTTIELKNPIVCFDLKGLEEHPDLQAVCLYIITDFVWREVQRDRSTKKILVMDECWRLLENEAGSAFIGEVFRTFRKYRASAIAISQNVDDFAKSKVATALLPNASTKWILMQKGSDQARLKEVLQLNDNELALVQSLKQERGVYSEAFLVSGDQRAVVAIESTPMEYWIATTDPADLSVFDSMRAEKPNLTTQELVMTLADKFPRGVSAKVNGQI